MTKGEEKRLLLLFRIRVRKLYHTRRLEFYRRYHAFLVLIALIFVWTTLFFPQPEISPLIPAGITTIPFLIGVFWRPDSYVHKHEKYLWSYKELERQMRRDTTNENFQRHNEEFHYFTHNTLPTRKVVLVLCHNAIARAQGDVDECYELNWFHKFTKNWFEYNNISPNKVS